MGGLWYCFIHMNMLMHLHSIIEIKWGSAHPKFNPWNLVWKMVFLFDQNAVGLHIEFTGCNGIWYTIQCDLGLGQRNWLSQNIDGLILYQDWCSLWVQRWLYVSRDRWAWLWDLLFFHPMICTHQTLSNLLPIVPWSQLQPTSTRDFQGFSALSKTSPANRDRTKTTHMAIIPTSSTEPKQWSDFHVSSVILTMTIS